MNDSQSFSTDVSLLSRIRRDDSDPAVWTEFVQRYGKRIYQWCDQRRLQPADAEDVTQEVLAILARKLGEFEYDESLTFRGWLRRVTENALIDFFRKRAARGKDTASPDHATLLNTSEAREDLELRLRDAFDLELLDMAKARVQSRVEPRRWLAWEWTAVDQRNGSEVAEKLEMNLPTVYSNRYQVQKMIADEVRQLEFASETMVMTPDVGDER